jgi:hypothetical protein
MHSVLGALGGTLVLGAVLTGCSEPKRVVQISEVRQVEKHRRPPKLDASKEERFGLRPMGPATQSGEPPPAPLVFDLPQGWAQLPPTEMRWINLQIAGHPQAECYVTVLPGSGGGLRANINRWRKQMGQPGFSEGEISALPKEDLLGQPATYVRIDGTFEGMSGSESNENFRLEAVALVAPEMAIFVKMIGPEKILDSQSDSFKGFCGSLRPSQEIMNPPPSSLPSLAWDTPEGWVRQPDRQMRIVTLSPETAPEVECYITILAGDGGGTAANLNRWRTQMGQNPLAHGELEALETLDVLGQPARLIEIEGNYSGMSMATVADALLVGLVCSLGDHAVFVKMTGPRDQVLEHKGSFRTFCTSLRQS